MNFIMLYGVKTTVIKMSLLPDSSHQFENDFPHLKCIDIGYGTDQWKDLLNWCNDNIGPENTLWGWQVSNKICFKNEEDAIKFGLAWQ